MEFHMINMIYVTLPIHAQTEKMTFSGKDDLYIDDAEHILYSVSLGDALTTAVVRPFFLFRNIVLICLAWI